MTDEPNGRGKGFGRTMGKFGEALIAWWLAGRGWEVAPADIDAVDLFAVNGDSRIGVQVKARTLGPAQNGVVYIDVKSIAAFEAACVRWGAKPMFAAVVDDLKEKRIDVLLMPTDVFRSLAHVYRNRPGEMRLHASKGLLKKHRETPGVLSTVFRYDGHGP